ncbi:MAG: hypothetical protein GXO39_01365 [Thermotogae bacterium]|nr:hypothetical protein [Thermotogota bacterium]
MTDHLSFFRDLHHNLKKDILILAGPEQYPAKTIVETFAEHLGLGVRSIWAGDRELPELMEDILKYTSAAMFGGHVVWIRFLPTDRAVVRTISKLLKHLEGVRGVVISAYEDPGKFSRYENDRILVVNMRPLKPKEFESWVLKRFKGSSEKVPTLRKRPELKTMLLEILPKDLRAAELEIKKLLLFSSVPTREAFELLWNFEEVQLYEITRKIQEGNKREALEILSKLREWGVDPSRVVSQILRDMTNLAYVKLNLDPPFVSKKYVQSVRKALYYVSQRISEGELREALEEIKRTELLLRSVLRGESRWAYLKVLVWKLASLFAANPRV